MNFEKAIKVELIAAIVAKCEVSEAKAQEILKTAKMTAKK